MVLTDRSPSLPQLDRAGGLGSRKNFLVRLSCSEAAATSRRGT
jgi:hypothetical protein